MVRLIPPIAEFSQSTTVGIVVMACFVIFDLMFLTFCGLLAFVTTKKDQNSYKTNLGKISLVQIYIEIYKWLLFIPKVDLFLSLIACRTSNLFLPFHAMVFPPPLPFSRNTNELLYLRRK